MTTLFDVGDKISFKLTGKILSYTKDRNGDCYTIEVEAKNRNTDGLRVYIETETLLACDAKKEA